MQESMNKQFVHEHPLVSIIAHFLEGEKGEALKRKREVQVM